MTMIDNRCQNLCSATQQTIRSTHALINAADPHAAKGVAPKRSKLKVKLKVKWRCLQRQMPEEHPPHPTPTRRNPQNHPQKSKAARQTAPFTRRQPGHPPTGGDGSVKKAPPLMASSSWAREPHTELEMVMEGWMYVLSQECKIHTKSTAF